MQLFKTLTGCFASSAKQLRSVQAVIFCGMMAAVAVILSNVASINIGPYIKIGISGLPNQVVAYLMGPVVGGIFGGVLDIVKFLIKPTGAFFPGFTLSAIAGGLIYGLFLYQQKLTWTRVLLAQAFVKVVVNIVFNTLWLKILYGKGFLALLPSRIVSNAVMLPIDTVLCFYVLRLVDRVRKSQLAGLS